MGKRKRQKASEVLRKLYRDDARPLADTILSILPSPPPAPLDCSCRGRRCLGCSGDYGFSFLVRPEDGQDYRRLLNQCFIFVPDTAPPFSRFDPHNRWPQLEIVRKSIEMTLIENPTTSNVICRGYNKFSRSSATVEHLTSSAWTVLARRVGDSLMVYLLKNTSIFLPLPKGNHLQVAGFPISDLCTTFPGFGRKRKRLDEVKILLSDANLGPNFSDASAKCYCCSVLLTIPKVIATTKIDRQTMFYKVDKSSSVLPKNHIINSLKPNSSGANILFRSIFGSLDILSSAQSMSCFHRQECSLIKSTCRYHALIKQLKSLIKKAKRCQHLRLLDKHCKISSLDQHTHSNPRTEGCNSGRNEGGKEYSTLSVACDVPLEKLKMSGSSSCRKVLVAADHKLELSKFYCPKKQVISFIWAACRSIVPRELLGDQRNWRVLRKNISHFICLRKFEKFSLKQCIHKLKVTKFALLSDKNPCCFKWSKECGRISAKSSVRDKILHNWIFWFFSHLVVALLQANFYITESEHGNQEVYYYTKSVWEKVISERLPSLEDQNYLKLNDASLSQIVLRRPFGFSRMRLCPKGKGFRVLANLQAPSKVPVKSSFKLQSKASSKPRNIKYAFFKPVNKLLSDAHVVLKGIQVKNSDMLGSSVFNYNDIYRKFAPFLSLLKSGSSSLPPVFVVVADVAKAFDSVDQDKLLTIMRDVISDNMYPLDRYLQVTCRRESIVVRNHLTVPLEDNFSVSLKCSSISPICAPNSILVNQKSSKRIKKEEILLNLNEHIKRNVLQLGNEFFLQKVGIPQGSILSPLLCSFYYGHLERNVIYPFLDKDCVAPSRNLSGASASGNDSDNALITCDSKYLLLRFIDDFLFVSTSRNQASQFLSQLQRGFCGYNCHMNKEKFGSNFGEDQIKSSRFYIGEDQISFLRWSGMLVNCSTLEIQADYMRYLNSHLSSSLTVHLYDHPGRVLKTKLCDYLRPKCHPLFYDSKINSSGVVRLNIYQAFLLCAMKFHCYNSSLNWMYTFCPEFYMEAIEKSLRFMHNLIKRRMHSLLCRSQSRFEVSKSEIEWLGLVAYFRVLKRKYPCYAELLCMLSSKLMKHGESINTSAPLQYAVDDTHSSVLWKIKY